MIEDVFRKWLIVEIDVGEYESKDLFEILTDEDEAEDVWDRFEMTHRYPLIDLVRTQVKAVLKKG